MDLSVVIITRDATRDLRRLLRSLESQVLRVGAEVIVVDDGSRRPDAVANVCATFAGPIRLLRRARDEGSRAASRNRGIDAARGRVVLFLDSDQVAPETLLSEHLRYHRAFDRACVIGFRRHAGPGGTVQCLRPEVRTRVTSRWSENIRALASAWYLTFTCNLSVTRDVLVDIHGFDEGFVGWGLEDSELGLRAWQHGAVIVHNPYAWTIDYGHVVRTDPQRMQEWQANRSHFLHKHAKDAGSALALLDNYPRGPGSLGFRWLESYERFERQCRVNLGRPESTPAALESVTVINHDDLNEVRERISHGESLDIIDFLPSSGLDLEIQLSPAEHIRYWVGGRW